MLSYTPSFLPPGFHHHSVTLSILLISYYHTIILSPVTLTRTQIVNLNMTELNTAKQHDGYSRELRRATPPPASPKVDMLEKETVCPLK